MELNEKKPDPRMLSSRRRRRRVPANLGRDGLGHYSTVSSPTLAELRNNNENENQKQKRKLKSEKVREGTCFGERRLKLSPRVEAMADKESESGRKEETDQKE